jgi:bifunctional aspartokinase / homoserine dehydrogenase 1
MSGGIFMIAESKSTINQTLVMKFGGTSVGTPDAMGQVVKIVATEKKNWKKLVVVTSALSGVTDLLIKMASGNSTVITSSADEIRRRHYEIADALISDRSARENALSEVEKVIAQVVSLCQAIAVLGESTPRIMDTVASAGERMCIHVLSAALQSAGIPAEPVEATRLIRTDSHFTDAHPDMQKTKELTCAVLCPILDQGIVPVVTGFLAAAKNGSITTLGRGGSDYSAALIGAALPADDVWIYTDVDGVMTADPRLVPNAATVPVCSYREIAELAYYGAKVLHPKTIRPVIEAGIGLRVCNTFNPTHPGTRLVSDLPAQQGIIKAITIIRNLQLITIEGRGMLGVPGVAARTFDTVAKSGASVPLITQASSEQSICFAIPVSAAADVVDQLTNAFREEIKRRDIDRVWATDEVGIVTVVGEGMKATPGVAGRVFTALGNNKVNAIAIAQGSSEVSISLVVAASQIQKALLVLHELIQ